MNNDSIEEENKNLTHIIFYSGGLGSWATAKRVSENVDIKNIVCLFTDTLIEDEDLYRFLLETTQEIYGVDNSDLIKRTKSTPPISQETMSDRKLYLKELAKDSTERNPNFIWLSDGRDPWDVFKDVRFLGNSRQANCSHELKQMMSAKWLKQNYEPNECVLYLGIDWMEQHRTNKPVKHWFPYTVKFPMCEEPHLTKIDYVKNLEELKIENPRLYAMGFEHNNCGGFCVRAGQGHFINLLNQNPTLYKYHEEKEQEMIDFLDRDVSILRKQKKKVKHLLTLRQLREEYEDKQTKDIDMQDIGGCGCFVD